MDRNETRWRVEQRPLRVLFGAGRLAELAAEAERLGGTRTLLVSDAGVEAAGHVERAVAGFPDGAALEVYTEVHENPTESEVDRAADRVRDFAPDLLIALGGGSVMDTVKGLNFVLTNGGRMRDYHGFGKASRPMLPMLGVPCTAGTGSEAQSYALIARDGDHLKMACGDEKARFRTVLLDPELATTVRSRVAAVTGLDAVSHALESAVTRTRNPVSTAFSKEAWRLLERSFDPVLDGAPTLEHWGDMLAGAHLAGAAIETSMLGAAHALANPLTAHRGLIHGAAVALMLPAVIRWNEEAVSAEYRGLAAGGAAELASRVEGWRAAAGLPATLSEAGVEDELLETLAADAAQQWTGQHNPRPLDRDAALALYRSVAEARPRSAPAERAAAVERAPQ